MCRPLRADGTIPPPLLADLDGEGYGRALPPLRKAGITDLDQLAAMTAGQCLKVKGVGKTLLDQIRVMLTDYGLHGRCRRGIRKRSGGGLTCRSSRESSGGTWSSAGSAPATRTMSGRPRRTDGFRFTTISQEAALAVAELYGGSEPRPWRQQWEVYTKLRRLPVALPPGHLVINQAMMRWSGGGPTVVCDGVETTRPKRGPCQCPQPDDPGDSESVWQAINERRRLAALKNPQGCYPYTWINVVLADIPGVGVWRMLSKSENAAAEIISNAVLLERARFAGQFLPAELLLEYRESRMGGLLRQYNVPVLWIGESARAIANGLTAGDLADQLPPAPGQPRAITAGPVPPQGRPADPSRKAQEIADRALTALSRTQVEALAAEAKREGVEHHNVCIDLDRELYDELHKHLQALWKDLPPEDGEGDD